MPQAGAARAETPLVTAPRVRAPRLISRQKALARSGASAASIRQTQGKGGLFPGLGAAIDRIEAKVDAGIERALGQPLDRLARRVETQGRILTPSGREAARRSAASRAKAERAPVQISAQPIAPPSLAHPAGSLARMEARLAEATPEREAVAAVTPELTPDLAPPAKAVAAEQTVATAPPQDVQAASVAVSAAEPGTDGWARMALARAGLLPAEAAARDDPAPAPWDVRPSADEVVPDRAASDRAAPDREPLTNLPPPRSSLVAGLTPLDEPDLPILADPITTSVPAHLAEPLAVTVQPAPNAGSQDGPDGRTTDGFTTDAKAVAPSLDGSGPTIPLAGDDGRNGRARRDGGGSRARISARSGPRPPHPANGRKGQFAKARLALQWQWAALRYKLRGAQVAAPAGRPAWRSRIGEGASRRTLMRGLIAVVGSVALVLGGHALFIAGLARWRAPTTVTVPANPASAPAPAAPVGVGQNATNVAPAPRLEPRSPQDFAALPATFPLLLGLPIRPERSVILPAPNDALDGTTIRAGAQIIKLARVDGPDAYAVCEGADGAPWACGLRARAALHNLVSQEQLTCRPVTEIGQRERRHSCEIAGQDIARLMVTAGWLKPDIHSEWAYGADASRARAGGEGLWRGGWRIRQR
jgi:endonuclease YncB( thermonuclease family)